MSIFKFKKQNQEYLFTPEELDKYPHIKSMIWPLPNNDVEFIVPQFNARKHYKHLKKMMWKYRR